MMPWRCYGLSRPPGRIIKPLPPPSLSGHSGSEIVVLSSATQLPAPWPHYLALSPPSLVGQSGSEVVVLSSTTQLPGLLLSLSRDGQLTLWDVRSGQDLGSAQTDACTAVRDDRVV